MNRIVGLETEYGCLANDPAGVPGVVTRVRDWIFAQQRYGLIDTVPLASGRGKEYRVTPAGMELEPVIMAMGEWAIRWIIGEPRDEDLDPAFILWWMHRRVNFDELPPGRTVVRFDILDQLRTISWLVLEPDEATAVQSTMYACLEGHMERGEGRDGAVGKCAQGLLPFLNRHELQQRLVEIAGSQR